MKLKVWLWALGVLLLAGVAVFFSLPVFVDKRLNTVALAPPYKANDRAQALHARLFVADLHDDALLWSRDLLLRHERGHSDLPRLQEGRVSLQVFSTVTKTPRGLNFERNSGDSDSITMLVMAQRWPRNTWNSLLERALYQSQKLEKAVQESGGQMVFVRARADLLALGGDKGPATGGKVGAVLATEGLHALEGKLENVDKLYEAGFRIAGLTHFFDNEVGGSAHGVEKGGLTPFGIEVVRRMEARKMTIDLAHASPKVIDDVLATARRPVIVSHGGVQATCGGPATLSDAHVKGIAAGGGLIGIGYFDGAICTLNTASIVRAMRHVANIAGVRRVALGSDFDGATRTVFDTTGLVLLTQGLLEAGFNEEEVALIMGGNMRRFLLEQLPAP